MDLQDPLVQRVDLALQAVVEMPGLRVLLDQLVNRVRRDQKATPELPVLLAQLERQDSLDSLDLLDRVETLEPKDHQVQRVMLELLAHKDQLDLQVYSFMKYIGTILHGR